jgi:hypothetical protein
MSDDESHSTKSANEDDAEASQEEDEKQEGENEEHEQVSSAQSARNTPSADTMVHPQPMTPMNVPIQPFYPPYPYPQYPVMPYPYPAQAPGTLGGANAFYVDHSLNPDPPTDRRNRGGVTEPFPEKLYK